MLRQQWPEEILENEVMTLVFAGHDTTAHATTIAIDNCVRHPHVIQEIRNEYLSLQKNAGNNDADLFVYSKMKWPTAAFKESLRLNPETPGGTVRQAPHDTQLGDSTIPKGCAVLSPFLTYSRSVGNWGPDAVEFKPERFLERQHKPSNYPRNSIPFSQGKRNCVGMPLAYLEASLLLGYIVCHVDMDIESPPTKVFKVTLRPEGFRIAAKRVENK